MYFNNDRGGFKGGDPAPTPFLLWIYCMPLRLYCKNVLYLVSKRTKRYLKGKNILKSPPLASLLHYTYKISLIYWRWKNVRPPLLKISVSGAEWYIYTAFFNDLGLQYITNKCKFLSLVSNIFICQGFSPFWSLVPTI